MFCIVTEIEWNKEENNDAISDRYTRLTYSRILKYTYNWNYKKTVQKERFSLLNLFKRKTHNQT